MRKYREVLAEKKQAAKDLAEKKANMSYEERVDFRLYELTVLISEMRKYMSIGSYAQRTPKKVLDEFRSLMSQANEVHVKLMSFTISDIESGQGFDSDDLL